MERHTENTMDLPNTCVFLHAWLWCTMTPQSLLSIIRKHFCLPISNAEDTFPNNPLLSFICSRPCVYNILKSLTAFRQIQACLGSLSLIGDAGKKRKSDSTDVRKHTESRSESTDQNKASELKNRCSVCWTTTHCTPISFTCCLQLITV